MTTKEQFAEMTRLDDEQAARDQQEWDRYQAAWDRHIRVCPFGYQDGRGKWFAPHCPHSVRPMCAKCGANRAYIGGGDLCAFCR